MRRLLPIGAWICALITFAGCMDGPFYGIKRVNPYYLSKWKKDREVGPTFEDRLAELERLHQQVAALPESEQEQWAERLVKIVREDSSAEMRARSVRTIALIPSPTAERALNIASADDVEKVRIMACKAWAERGGSAARDMLLSLASTDDSNSVRQAAIDGLAEFNDPEVVRALGSLLDDSSPAVQHQTIRSLAAITGSDFNGDVGRWKEYVASAAPSQAVAESANVLPASGTLGIPASTP